MMRRVLLFAVPMLSFSLLIGCGGGDSVDSPEAQEETLEEVETNMSQGMEAMEAMNKE